MGKRTPFHKILENRNPHDSELSQPKLIYEALKRMKSIHIDSDIPPRFRKLISSCLQIQPNKRPSAQKIVDWICANSLELQNEICILEKNSLPEKAKH